MQVCVCVHVCMCTSVGTCIMCNVCVVYLCVCVLNVHNILFRCVCVCVCMNYAYTAMRQIVHGLGTQLLL